MTALKPIENRRVRGIASEEYPLNRVCAHPECSEKVTLTKDGKPHAHHAFPSSQTKSRSYFVAIEETAATFASTKWMHQFATTTEGLPPDKDAIAIVVPHATGLCGSGTTGHHGDAEEHRAWIKFEEGVWNWYELSGMLGDPDEEKWTLVGPLNPQPGSTEGKPKKKGKKHGEPRANRANWSMKVPLDEIENGADLMDEQEALAREILVAEDAIVSDAPRYRVIFDAVRTFNEDYGHVLKKGGKK